MNEFLAQNAEIVLRLVLAMGLGMLIGAERIFVGKEAGMKTHAFVSLGAALFVVISEMIAFKYGGVDGFDPSRIASQIIVGIGFLGAGSIMLRGTHLSGLTTAGGLWVTAGIGMASGFGFFSLAIFSSLLVFFVLIVINILEKPIRQISEDIDKL